MSSCPVTSLTSKPSTLVRQNASMCFLGLLPVRDPPLAEKLLAGTPNRTVPIRHLLVHYLLGRIVVDTNSSHASMSVSSGKRKIKLSRVSGIFIEASILPTYYLINTRPADQSFTKSVNCFVTVHDLSSWKPQIHAKLKQETNHNDTTNTTTKQTQ